MSRRLNLYGFSLPQMRKLFGSQNVDALAQLQLQLRERPGMPLRPVEDVVDVYGVIDRAVMHGVPFSDLAEETYLHSQAVSEMAAYEQEWFITDASGYNASALEHGLWTYARKYASPEAKTFVRGLAQGIPLFGNQPASDGSSYAVMGLDRLRVFLPHVRDLAEIIEYRVNNSRSVTDEDREAVTFANDFCGWLEAISTANRDLLLVYG